MDEKHRQLLVSIFLVLIWYLILESAAFSLAGWLHGFPANRLALYNVAQLFFHVLLFFFLYFSRRFFYIEKTGKELDKVNIANKITLFRLSLLPTILFLILSAKEYDIAPLLLATLAVAFITDMIDGRLSRARKEVTRIGRILDSVSDYSLLLVIAVAYRVFHMIPIWLFCIIFGRLVFQACGMLTVLLIKGEIEPKPTILGKVAIASTMTLFAVEALKLVTPPSALSLYSYVEIVVGFIVAVSVLDKGYYFFKQSQR